MIVWKLAYACWVSVYHQHCPINHCRPKELPMTYSLCLCLCLWFYLKSYCSSRPGPSGFAHSLQEPVIVCLQNGFSERDPCNPFRPSGCYCASLLTEDYIPSWLKRDTVSQLVLCSCSSSTILVSNGSELTWVLCGQLSTVIICQREAHKEKRIIEHNSLNINYLYHGLTPWCFPQPGYNVSCSLYISGHILKIYSFIWIHYDMT